MRYIFIIGMTIVILGCSANTMRTATITEAYKEFKSEDYEETLELITLAENIKGITPEIKAELTYLKAQTYEKLGEHDKAATLYTYLSDQHANSQYGYLAAKKLPLQP